MNYVGLPPVARPKHALDIASVTEWFQAADNFARVFAIRASEKVLILADPLLDPRVIDAVRGLAQARGATVRVVTETSTRIDAVPDNVKPLLEAADFVVSTWFCSILDPFNIALRKRGQRWVKITYFRDLDLLQTPQARFPAELVGEIIRATARAFPQAADPDSRATSDSWATADSQTAPGGGAAHDAIAFDLQWSDPRGSDFCIGFTAAMRKNLLAGNRWRGRMLADEPGCYVHYLPTHGPNLWDRTAHGNDNHAPVKMSGTIYPTWAVGFGKPWPEKIGCRFEADTIVEVTGEGEAATILRDMLMGGKLIELGCGFNPKAPRHTIYPAGSNHPGALHFGIDLAKPSEWIRRVMPDWEEPPVHMDLITFDSTVEALIAGRSVAGAAAQGVAQDAAAASASAPQRRTLIDAGFLTALRDPEVIKAAGAYGDPVALLETET